MLGGLSLFCLKELGVGHKTLVHPHRIYGSVQMDIQRPFELLQFQLTIVLQPLNVLADLLSGLIRLVEVEEQTTQVLHRQVPHPLSLNSSAAPNKLVGV